MDNFPSRTIGSATFHINCNTPKCFKVRRHIIFLSIVFKGRARILECYQKKEEIQGKAFTPKMRETWSQKRISKQYLLCHIRNVERQGEKIHR